MRRDETISSLNEQRDVLEMGELFLRAQQTANTVYDGYFWKWRGMFSSSRYPERTFAIVNAAMRLAGIKEKLTPAMLSKLSRAALLALTRYSIMSGTYAEVQKLLDAGEYVPKRRIDEIDARLWRASRNKPPVPPPAVVLNIKPRTEAPTPPPPASSKARDHMERDLRQVLAKYYLSQLVSHEQILETLDKITDSLRAVTKLAS